MHPVRIIVGFVMGGGVFQFCGTQPPKAAISLQIFKPEKPLLWTTRNSCNDWSILSRGPARILRGHKSFQKRRNPLQTSVKAQHTRFVFRKIYFQHINTCKKNSIALSSCTNQENKEKSRTCASDTC